MNHGRTKAAEALRKIAARHPDVEEGIACKGTTLECATFGVRKKVFLFLSVKDAAHTVRLKLHESKAAATRLAKQEPGRYQIGAQGWAKVTFGAAEAPPLELLEKWIGESYRVVVEPGGKTAKNAKNAKTVGKKG